MSSVVKKVGKWALLVVLIFLGSILLFLAVRAIAQCIIRNQHAIKQEGGIDAEETIQIGGLNQYLYIRGEDISNPVVLFLHGGPGSSMIPMIYKYQDALEKEYTIVNWDQRSSGKTYYLNDKDQVSNTLSMERMVADVDEVVEYLKEKFQKKKIIILGHSWGSVLGTTYVQKYPDKVDAYIGIGQVIEMNVNERTGYDAALAAVRLAGNEKDIAVLESYPDYPLVDGKYNENAVLMQRAMTSKYLAPSLKDNTVSTLLFSPYCSLKEGLLYLKPLMERQKGLYDYLFYEMKNSPYDVKFEMPVIYIMGKDDWVSPNAPARAFFDTIEAPDKEWITIENAGHLSMLDQPDIFCDSLMDALEKALNS